MDVHGVFSSSFNHIRIYASTTFGMAQTCSRVISIHHHDEKWSNSSSGSSVRQWKINFLRYTVAQRRKAPVLPFARQPYVLAIISFCDPRGQVKNLRDYNRNKALRAQIHLHPPQSRNALQIHCAVLRFLIARFERSDKGRRARS